MDKYPWEYEDDDYIKGEPSHNPSAIVGWLMVLFAIVIILIEKYGT
jgi:hypothetical protein